MPLTEGKIEFRLLTEFRKLFEGRVYMHRASEGAVKRTAMSTKELLRVEVFGRVAGRSLRLLDAQEILQLS